MKSINEIQKTSDISVLKKAIKYKNPKYRIAVTNNVHLTHEIITTLSEDEDINVLTNLAKSTLLDESIFGKLYDKENILVFRELARNPKCPTKYLDSFIDNSDLFLDLVSNPIISIEYIEKINEMIDTSSYCFDLIIEDLQKRSDIKDIKRIITLKLILA